MFDLDDFSDRKPMKKKEREMELMRGMLANKMKFDNNPDNDSDSDESLVDWGDIDAHGAAGAIERWKNYHTIEKNFYHSHPAVEKLTQKQVDEWRQNNHNIQVGHLVKESDAATTKKLTLEEIPKPCTEFIHSFDKYPEILDTIKNQGFEKPSPIQAQLWPCVMQGYDAIGIAQTGTGKTLAFLLPMFLHISAQLKAVKAKPDIPKRKGPIALILSPTRELALQIEHEINKYTYQGIKCICIYGGGDVKKQARAIENGCEIVVATPGRFNDLVAKDVVALNYISYVVLDEADRMLDMGFEPQILKIFLDIRPDRTTLMTSATWPEGVRRLCNTYLKNPIQVVVGSLDLSTVYTVTQYIKIIDDETKKEETLMYYIDKMKPEDKYIIFVNKKALVDQLASNCCLRDIPCDSIHGGRDQECREQALREFKNGDVRILFATDVASRGIDVSDITVVINYDFPKDMEEYVHRCGRTGRQGKKGKALSIITRRDWRYAPELVELLEKSNQNVPEKLRDMSVRFKKWKERKDAEDAARGGSRSFGRSGGRLRYRQ